MKDLQRRCSKEVKLYHNGGAWRAVWDDFIDSQHSPEGYGMTMEEAIEDLKALEELKRIHQ